MEMRKVSMKKIVAGLLVALSIATPAMAHGQSNPWVPFGVGVLLGNVIATRPTYVYQQVPPPQVIYAQPTTVYVYPTQASPITVPQLGYVCELKSEMVNGQVVTGNFCYHR
jgi:hypothetical protein